MRKKNFKFAHDGELRTLSSAFFEAAFRSRQDAGVPWTELWAKGELLIHSGSVTIAMSEDVDRAIPPLLERCMALLGVVQGDEGRILDLALDAASSAASPTEALERFFELLDSEKIAEFRSALPNFLFELEPSVPELRIGNVRIRRTADVAQEAKAFGGRVELRVGELGFNQDGAGAYIGLPQFCWDVTTKATKPNVTEETQWMIDVATSIWRLVGASVAYSNNYPCLGETERHPVRVPDEKIVSATISENGIYGGGYRSKRLYAVTNQQLVAFQKSSLATVAESLAVAQVETVGGRLVQGLGWMTRARRSSDRSERVLHFFTAIEALLSKDKLTPVVDTISRYMACILEAPGAARCAIAERVRQLYDVRSNLVHRGARLASSSHGQQIQSLCESLYSRVLSEVDMTQGDKDFFGGLRAASYGSEWPPAPMSRPCPKE